MRERSVAAAGSKPTVSHTLQPSPRRGSGASTRLRLSTWLCLTASSHSRALAELDAEVARERFGVRMSAEYQSTHGASGDSLPVAYGHTAIAELRSTSCHSTGWAVIRLAAPASVLFAEPPRNGETSAARSSPLQADAGMALARRLVLAASRRGSVRESTRAVV